MYELKANRRKCKFMQDYLECCGHTISAQGLHQSEKKVEAIAAMLRPQDTTQVRSFLGMVQYYSRFLSNLAMHLEPLHRSLKENASWKWGEEQERAFNNVKDMLLQNRVLTHFDPSLPITLACDSSSYGLGVAYRTRWLMVQTDPLRLPSGH